MIKEIKPIDFNSKNVFKALFTTITLMVGNLFSIAFLSIVIKNSFIAHVIVYTIFILFIFLCNKRNLIDSFKNIKKDIKSNYKSILLYTLLFLLLEFIANFIIIKLTGKNINNNVTLMNVFNEKNKVLFISYILLIGPIFESLMMIYPYKEIPNKKLAYIFMTIIFALFHLMNASTLLELLFFIPYLFMGFAFNYSFYKTNNIYLSIIIHSINDLIVFVLLLI